MPSTQSKPELISFKLCPFVQRSVITLLEKGVEFDITYIDLAEPPAWFLAISPLGKVPLLRVGDAVLFESAVINEYLDEIYPPSMHPSDPLLRAQNRAWIEFASNVIGDQYHLMIAKNAETYQDAYEALLNKLSQLEQQLTTGPYFNGDNFSLLDAAIAPVFMRMDLLAVWHEIPEVYQRTPKVAEWQAALLQRDSVRRSVVAEFAEELRAYLVEQDAYIATRFSQ